MATLVLVFKRQKLKIKQSLTIFIQTQKQKQLSMKVILMMCFTQSILRMQKALRKDPGCIIDSVTDHTISISK